MSGKVKKRSAGAREGLVAEGPDGYAEFLAATKERIARARTRAAMAVSRELLELYWNLGKGLVERQAAAGWTVAVVDRFAADLASAFPGASGFSRTNLFRMRAFFQAYPPFPQAVGMAEEGVALPVPQAVGMLDAPLPSTVVELPWGHHIMLIEKLKDPDDRLWYARAAREHGWSRAVLEAQIESGARKRWGQSHTNFARTLPAPQSELAQQMMRDPFNFEFLLLEKDAEERALERGLLEHVQKFLLELGVGFALLGSQYHLEVQGDDFYVDLLLYHTKLHCYVVVELKRTPFRPEYAGKVNFYLSVIDDKLRDPAVDHPSIGIILCKDKKGSVVEYALRDIGKPMGVSTYKTRDKLPPELAEQLPTVEQLEAALAQDS